MTPIETLRARVAELNRSIQALNDKVVSESRSALNADEAREYKKLAVERQAAEDRVAQLTEEESRRSAGSAALQRLGLGNGASVAGKDLVYGKGSGNSYFRDLLAAATPGSHESYGAMQRLNDHANMLERVPESDLPSEFRAGPHKRAAGSGRDPEMRVNPNRTDGQGGYFVPPLWLINEYAPLLRAGRTLADRCNRKDLPTGTDSINLPKVLTGTLTGVQQDNGSVTSQDLTDTFVSAPVRTIAGQEDIAMQLFEQSPVDFDEIVFQDLTADYNQKLDYQVGYGSGAAGQLKGINNATGTNTITYTSGSPTVPGLYPVVAQGASQVARQRFAPPTGMVMTPQRWYWITSALDGQNRPLVPPTAGSGETMNGFGTTTSNAEGATGTFAGQPVYIDANILSNDGVGLNQDRLIVAKFDDFYLWEGAIRFRALQEVLSGTLQVRLQMYNYVAFMPDRYPVGASIVVGTGLVSPSGY